MIRIRIIKTIYNENVSEPPKHKEMFLRIEETDLVKGIQGYVVPGDWDIREPVFEVCEE